MDIVNETVCINSLYQKTDLFHKGKKLFSKICPLMYSVSNSLHRETFFQETKLPENNTTWEQKPKQPQIKKDVFTRYLRPLIQTSSRWLVQLTWLEGSTFRQAHTCRLSCIKCLFNFVVYPLSYFFLSSRYCLSPPFIYLAFYKMFSLRKLVSPPPWLRHPLLGLRVSKGCSVLSFRLVWGYNQLEKKHTRSGWIIQMASSLNLLYTQTDRPLLPDFYQSKHVVYSPLIHQVLQKKKVSLYF